MVLCAAADDWAEKSCYGPGFLYIIQAYTSKLPQIYIYSHCRQKALPRNMAQIVALWSKTVSDGYRCHVQTFFCLCFFLLNTAWCNEFQKNIFSLFQSWMCSSFLFLFILSGINELAARQTEGPPLDGALSSIVWIKPSHPHTAYRQCWEELFSQRLSKAKLGTLPRIYCSCTGPLPPALGGEDSHGCMRKVFLSELILLEMSVMNRDFAFAPCGSQPKFASLLWYTSNINYGRQ